MTANYVFEFLLEIAATKEGTAIVAISSMIFGGFITYWFEIGLAKRVEYNELADRLFVLVDQQLSAHDAHTYAIPEKEIKLIRRRMKFWQRRNFDKAIARYTVASKHIYHDNYGQVHFTDLKQINDCLKQIASILSRR